MSKPTSAILRPRLVNLAVNARDAMNGEGILLVSVREMEKPQLPHNQVGASGLVVAVSVTDKGSGISPENLSLIFEPFYTTKEVGKGTGLGLSQVYGFVKQSGGDVTVESVVGKGSTFTIYLPKVECAKVNTILKTRDIEQVDHGRGRRVLVVEDNVEVGRFSTQILEDLGYVTTWAANGNAALQILEAGESFDVVFSDVVMPGMGGIELGEEIRQRFPELPVILTSGYSEVMAEEGQHGFDLIKKPYAVEDLSRILRRLTSKKHRLRSENVRKA